MSTVVVVAGQPRASAIANLTRSAQGADVSALAQDISAATDLVTAASSYDSEIVDLSGTIADAFVSGGSGFQRATITSAGITGDTNFQFRGPGPITNAFDLVPTCHFVLHQVPVNTFNAAIEVGPYVASDLTVSGCPAPTVATALASTATTVTFSFSRNILATTVNAADFTFDHGLTAVTAVAAGRTVIVTTTAQTAGTTYTATIAHANLTDLEGTKLVADATKTFTGFAVAATSTIRINEINAGITGGCDLIEIRVLADTDLTGFKLFERNGVVAVNNELDFTFPAFQAHKNDLIVVHTTGTGAATVCNPGGAVDEVTTPTAQAAATFTSNFDGAFDFYATDNGLTGTDNVITLFAANGTTIVDAVFLTSGTGSINTLSAAAVVGSALQWVPAATAYIAADFTAAAVPGLNMTTGPAATGISIQRVTDADDNSKDDWTTAPIAPTFGALNVGQVAIP